MRYKSITSGAVVFLSLISPAFAQGPQSDFVLPASTPILVAPEVKIVAGKTFSNQPVRFVVIRDVRSPQGREVLIERGSWVTSHILNSEQAGRIKGKAYVQLTFEDLVRPDGSTYSIDARIIKARARKKEYDVKYSRYDTITGQGHAKRDAVLSILPTPLAPIQWSLLLARGPELILDEETELTLILMSPLKIKRNSLATVTPAAKTQLEKITTDGVEKLIATARDNNLAQNKRVQAVKALGELGDRRAVEPLIKMLLNGSDRELRSPVVWALGMLKAKEAIDLLTELAVTEESKDVKITLVKALCMTGDKRSLAALRFLAHDDDVEVSATAQRYFQYYFQGTGVDKL